MTRHAVDIAAPPDVVYQLLADARRRSAWLPELETVDAPDRALQEGDRFVGVAALAGHHFIGTSDVVEADDGHHLAERVVIGVRFRTAWTVDEQPSGANGCRVTHDIDVELPRGPLARVAGWLLTRYVDRLQRQGLDRLARAAVDAAVR